MTCSIDQQIGQLYELMQALQKRGAGLADEEMDEALDISVEGSKKS